MSQVLVIGLINTVLGISHVEMSWQSIISIGFLNLRIRNEESVSIVVDRELQTKI